MALSDPSCPSPESRFQDLLREARNGSEEARWLVVQLFRKSMLAIANHELDDAVQPREGASDIVQETIVEAQRDLDRFQGITEGDMRAWLKTVLSRNISNLHRKYRTNKRDLKRERSIEPKINGRTPFIPDPNPTPSSVVARREAAEAIEAAIRELPEQYQQIINYRYRKGLSYQEIARLMGRTEVATRRLWSRALHELSQRVNSRSKV